MRWFASLSFVWTAFDAAEMQRMKRALVLEWSGGKVLATDHHQGPRKLQIQFSVHPLTLVKLSEVILRKRHIKQGINGWKLLGRVEPILGDLGAVSGGGKRSKRAKKKKLGKEKSRTRIRAWGQGFNGPLQNGRGNSGFWLVPENFCFFLPNHRAARLGVVSCLLTP